eukprot:2119069-Prymnesium_polylepis.1
MAARSDAKSRGGHPRNKEIQRGPRQRSRFSGDRSGYASGRLDDFSRRTAAAAPASAPYAVSSSQLLLRWPDFNLPPARTCRR